MSLDSYSIQKRAQKTYREFAESVLPGDVSAREDLSHAALANFIDDRGSSGRAITLLDANISHSRDDATLTHAKGPNQTFTVASTIVVVHYSFGVTAALIGAGVWYWLIANSETSALMLMLPQCRPTTPR